MAEWLPQIVMRDTSVTGRPDLAALRRLPALLQSHPGLDEFRLAVPYLILVAWLLWSWLAVSVVLQALVAALELATRGAAWVRALRPLVDMATGFTDPGEGSYLLPCLIETGARSNPMELAGLEPAPF